jgi:ABC-type proline/glycine betaine transport system ATPase subunit
MKNILVLILVSTITIVSKGQNVNLGTHHIFETNRVTHNCNDAQTFPDKIMMYKHRWVFQDGSPTVILHHISPDGELILIYFSCFYYFID